jgi:hypothetical protein
VFQALAAQLRTVSGATTAAPAASGPHFDAANRTAAPMSDLYAETRSEAGHAAAAMHLVRVNTADLDGDSSDSDSDDDDDAAERWAARNAALRAHQSGCQLPLEWGQTTFATTVELPRSDACAAFTDARRTAEEIALSPACALRAALAVSS